jgi:cell division protein FtsA
LSEKVSKDDTVNVPSVGGRPSRSLQRQTLAEVIEPRYSELMGMVSQTVDSVQAKLREDGIKHHLAAGVVLTGGAAQIPGLVECAERVFRSQVRIGKPLDVSGLTDYVKEPYQSTAVGLLHYAKDNQFYDDGDYLPSAPKQPHSGTSVAELFRKLRNWVQKEF